jgi:hypothetical protein
MHANVNHDCALKRHTHIGIKHHARSTTAAWLTSSSRFSSSFEQPHHASKFYSAALPATRLSSQKLVVTPCATLAPAVGMRHCALTVPPAVLELALVNFTIGKGLLASSVPIAVIPLALVNLATRVSECASTVASAVALSQVSAVHPRFSFLNCFVLQGAHEVQLGGIEERGVTGVLTCVTYLVPGGAQPGPRQ